eukprot:TRINITY_DN3027_c0_g3_i1.p1 TRINITY_DN3027_c0_g3~~TRINITY_DN3027_c0_g3_i1.p1  ORF type:complete len:242 (-),score=26.06 TRINITY_DN3027_c0_g3_i1:833-1558(-)
MTGYTPLVKCFLVLLLTKVSWSTYVVREQCGDTENCIEVGGLSFRELLEKQDRKALILNINLWARKQKLLQANLVIKDTPTMGLGVYSLQDLEPLAPLMQIPTNLQLSKDSIAIEYFDEPTDKLFEHCFDFPKPDFDTDDQLTFAFLYHLTHYENSALKHYLLLISPKERLGFLKFSDEEIALLEEDESLVKQIKKNREELYKRYYKMKEIYESTYTLEQRISLLGHPTISMADYVWAWLN